MTNYPLMTNLPAHDRIRDPRCGFGRGLHGDEHVDHDSGDDLEDHGGYAIT